VAEGLGPCKFHLNQSESDGLANTVVAKLYFSAAYPSICFSTVVLIELLHNCLTFVCCRGVNVLAPSGMLQKHSRSSCTVQLPAGAQQRTPAITHTYSTSGCRGSSSDPAASSHPQHCSAKGHHYKPCVPASVNVIRGCMASLYVMGCKASVSGLSTIPS
jgi:hypothetical protein